MNRPSRTEDDLEHPAWNQNPPFLAPDLTTRQDLNGIANARVQRSRCAASGAFGLDEKHLTENCGAPEFDTEARPNASLAVGGIKMPFIASGPELGGEGQARLARSTRPLGWVGWVASVVVVSMLVSFLRDALPTLFSAGGSGAPPAIVASPAASVELASLLVRRQDKVSCGAGGIQGDYDVPLHVGALFIIFGVSGIACGFPLLAVRFPVLRIPANFFFAVRHFGTGVLLATAFVHLLPTAFISLGDPCLSNFWTTDYPPMPGAIALLGIFFVTIIEMVFSPARQFGPHTSHVDIVNESKADGERAHERARRSGGHGHCGTADISRTVTRPAAVRHHSIELAEAPRRASSLEASSPSHVLSPEQRHKKEILQCLMLEVGILFHSVFIGMALSISIGREFVVLLIAIAFHQTFEGLALGARIASISWPDKTWQPWLMVLAYGCTTPVGQAIGLATHTLYSPNSEFGLILVGTMNALSAGLLVFASLIELLAEDFLSDESWIVMRGMRRVVACGLVLLGAVLMSLVGAWA